MESKIYLETGCEYGKTVIKDVYFSAPYKIMSPFYDGEHCDIVQMSSSAGILAGDRLEAELLIDRNSDVRYLSQSYEKVFDTKESSAEKRLILRCEENSSLVYMPYPVIPFQNSNFKSVTEVHLRRSAKFIYSDIFTCGRTGMGEYYRLKSFESRLKVYIDGRLDYADHTLIRPSDFDYKGMGMWGEYTHNGMLYIHLGESDDMGTDELEKARGRLKEKIHDILQEHKKLLGGVTLTERGILVRSLGYRGENIFQFHKTIAAIENL